MKTINAMEEDILDAMMHIMRPSEIYEALPLEVQIDIEIELIDMGKRNVIQFLDEKDVF